ncbi:glycoside hydrolase domain-containing protein [Fredinandcohnia humi]
MTEKMFNIILGSILLFLSSCAVFFYLTEQRAETVASNNPTSHSITPPPSSKPKKTNATPENNPTETEKNTNKKEENNPNKDATSDNGVPEIIWGIDSASETSEEFYACVREHFGDPVVFGRYLGDIEGVSKGLTAKQVKLIHSKGDYILPIYNHFDNATGYENGVSQAKEAIKLASEIGMPKGIAIFADIEPNYPVDSEFIRGWFETISNSQYKSGIYGVFDQEQNLSKAFNEAIEKNQDILENNYIWTAAPNIGITTQAKAPKYTPEAPENSLVWGWQYGIDAESCNIDTNLFKGALVDVLWGP